MWKSGVCSFGLMSVLMMGLSWGQDAQPFVESPLRPGPLSISWSLEGDKVGYLIPDGDGLAFCTLNQRGKKTCYLRGVPGASPPKATPTPSPTPTQTPEPIQTPPPVKEPTPEAQAQGSQDPQDPVMLYQAVISAPDGASPDVSQGLKPIAPKATPTPKPKAPRNGPKSQGAPPPPRSDGGILEIPLDLRGYQWRPGGEDVLIDNGHDLILLTLETGIYRNLTRTPGVPEHDPQFTADGQGLVFLAGGHLYWQTLETGSTRRLSKTPISDLHSSPYGSLYRALYAPRESQGMALAPKGGYVAYLTLDAPDIPGSQGVGSTPGLHPGDPLPKAGIRVVNASGRVAFAYDQAEEGYILPAFAFTPDGQSLAYMLLDRHQDTLRVMLADLPSGESTLLFEETMPHFFPPPEAPYFLPNGKQYIWMSPYYGFHQPHLGTVSKAPDRPKRMLRDPWNLDFQGFDERGRWMYLVGSGEVPTERYLYRMHPTGGGLKRMTLRWGWHDVLVAPGGDAFVDTFSDPNTPPVTSVWRDRERIGVMEDRRAALKNTTPGSRKILRINAEDDQQLFADMRLPPAEGPVPVVIRMVTGPGEQSVTKAYLPDALTLRLLKDGIGVVTFDTRGTGGRMHRFSWAIDEAPGTAELSDIEGLLGHLRDEAKVDISRSVFLGEGYGGLKALKAVEAGFPSKGVVAISPITDFETHLGPIGERYLGLPSANPEGYDEARVHPSTIADAAPALIIVGEGDDSIHPSQGARLLRETFGHDTPPELLWIPGGSQPLTDDPMAGPYVVDQIARFVAEVLASP